VLYGRTNAESASPDVGTIWNKGMMSSVRQDWATPRTLFEMLSKEFHFTLDVCATAETAVCEEFFFSEALERHWVPVVDGSVWCNPPYGRKIGDWVEKGYRESRGYGTVVMLLPARTDTQWFHDYCLKGEIRFLRGRLSFDDQKRKSRAPFPSMLVIFRAREQPA
jgi:phage N-6-adenine-methyltransferase